MSISLLHLLRTVQVDRAHYAPASPYKDSPQSLGPAGLGATISAPHMHATAISHLLPYLTPSDRNPAPRVLDIGSGSGYLTHVIAELVGDGDGALVVGVEHVPALRDMARANLAKSAGGRRLLASGRVRLEVGDGRKGWADGAGGPGGQGWDAIHVGASAARVHDELVTQLRAPGRMFIPVDDVEGGGKEEGQHVWAVEKDENGAVSRKRLFAVRYVPLTDGPKN